MAKTKSLKCENCVETSEVESSHSFLGFPKMTCPKCKYENEYPLVSSRRSFYIFLIVLGVVIFLGAVSTGRSFTPGVLFIVAIYAIYYDNNLIKKSKETQPEKNLPFTDLKDKTEASFCHNCGKSIQNNEQFCSSCGTKI